MNPRFTRPRLLLSATTTSALLLLIITGLTVIGLRSGAIGHKTSLEIRFERVDGLRVGDSVRLQGLRVGTVARIEPPRIAGDPIRTTLKIDPEIAKILRNDATAAIATSGMIGQPVVELQPGSTNAQPLDLAVPMAGQSSATMTQLTAQAAKTLSKLDEVAKQAEIGLVQVNQITGVIARGEGSLGKLVKDEEAYQKLVGLGHKGERTLDDVQENLESLKRSWIFSRMFDQRGFYERDTALYEPSSDKFQQSLATSVLFNPESSILTDAGRRLIDQSVVPVKEALKPNSKLIIAAFCSEPLKPENESLNRFLTQKQAESVREYLENVHRISSINLFQWREVAAIGFGSKSPPHMKNNAPTDSRVEIVVFTPRPVEGLP